MIANESGKTAPPAPWITRATIITPIEVASAASSVPNPSTIRTTTIVRFLPYMSPSRPAIGVTTEALSRYAVRIHAGPGGRRVQVLLDRQQRRRDERLQQRVGDRGHRQEREGDVVVLARDPVGHALDGSSSASISSSS